MKRKVNWGMPLTIVLVVVITIIAIIVGLFVRNNENINKNGDDSNTQTEIVKDNTENEDKLNTETEINSEEELITEETENSEEESEIEKESESEKETEKETEDDSEKEEPEEPETEEESETEEETEEESEETEDDEEEEEPNKPTKPVYTDESQMDPSRDYVKGGGYYFYIPNALLNEFYNTPEATGFYSHFEGYDSHNNPLIKACVVNDEGKSIEGSHLYIFYCDGTIYSIR